MCDRAVPQQNLCAELAALAGALPDDAAVAPWLAAFWATLAREWTAVDALRLEKFLLLVRRVTCASLEWARGAGGGGGGGERGGRRREDEAEEEEVEEEEDGKMKKRKKVGKWDVAARRDALLDLFRDWPLETTGDLSKMPVGLRLHVLDIWVDELARAGFLRNDDNEEEEEEGGAGGRGEEEDDDDEDAEFLQRLRGLVEAQLKSPSKPVRARAKESLADDRLPWNRSRGGDEDEDEEEDDDEEDGWGGFKD